MLKKEVARGPRGRVIVMDSITKVTPQDCGSQVVCAFTPSHQDSVLGSFPSTHGSTGALAWKASTSA